VKSSPTLGVCSSRRCNNSFSRKQSFDRGEIPCRSKSYGSGKGSKAGSYKGLYTSERGALHLATISSRTRVARILWSAAAAASIPVGTSSMWMAVSVPLNRTTVPPCASARGGARVRWGEQSRRILQSRQERSCGDLHSQDQKLLPCSCAGINARLNSRFSAATIEELFGTFCPRG